MSTISNLTNHMMIPGTVIGTGSLASFKPTGSLFAGRLATSRPHEFQGVLGREAAPLECERRRTFQKV